MWYVPVLHFILESSNIQHPIDIKNLYKSLNVIVLSKEIDQSFHSNGIAKFRYRQVIIKTKIKIKKLVSNEWDINLLINLINKIDIIDFSEFANAVEIIADYNIPKEAVNKEGLTAQSIFENTKASDWSLQFNKLAAEYNFADFTVEKDEQTLIKEILDSNINNVKVKELVESSYIKTQLKQIRNAELKNSTISSCDKAIHLWGESDITIWAKEIIGKDIKDNLPEVMAVIKRAMFLTHGYNPRTIQIISALLLYNADSGRLAEISTGEGKSNIVAILAAIKALESKQVDIVTSSSILAQRDAAEQVKFYGLFGLTVADNTDKSTFGQKECYQKDIVYGDIASFVGDLLKHEHLEQNVRGNRKFDAIIVDEVDSMLIDQSSHIVMLSHQLPSFEYLEPILVALWENLLYINQHFQYIEQVDKLLWVSGEFKYEKGELILLGEGSEAYEISDKIEFTKKLLTDYLNKLIENDQSMIFIPKHLNEFVKNQVNHWIISAIHASILQENQNYVIISKEDGQREIAPIDYRNTGVIQVNTNWSDGLHQFLQIKHGIKLKAETLVTSFMSNMRYFKKYAANIYGMTGTIGAEMEKSLLHDIYGVDFVSIPTYKSKQFIELPGIVAVSKEDWQKQVITGIYKETKKGRAVLVIAETILQVHLIEKLLKSIGHPEDKVKRYTRNDTTEKLTVTSSIDSGEVIIATNLAGRGTDIKTTKNVEENGGLHVVVTYLPTNLRVQFQAYGRTSRQGNSGTAQMVINAPEAINYLNNAYPWYSGANDIDIYNIIEWRNLAENERLLRDRFYKVEMMSLQDELFGEFSKFVHSLKDQKMGPIRENGKRICYEYDEVCVGAQHEIEQIEELWGIWLKKQRQVMNYEISKKVDEEDKLIFKQRNQGIKAKMFAAFQEFKSSIEAEYKADSVIKNPSYLTKRGLENKSIVDLEKAIILDETYAFAPHHAKARVVIENSGNSKQEAYNNLLISREKIINFMIPQLESNYHMLGMSDITNNDKDLSKQIQTKIDIYKKHVEYIDKSMEIIKNSGSDELIKISTIIPIEDVFGDDSGNGDKDNEINELKNIGMGEFFEVSTYVPKKGGFLGSVFSFFAGIIQIVIGAAITVGSAGFGASLGVGMIVDGVSDILSSIKSIITGKGIDINQYFKEKGISYAINLISAGITTAITAVKESITGVKKITEETTKQVVKESAHEAHKVFFTETVKSELTRQGAIKSLSYLAEIASANILNEYKEDIENHVREHIQNMLASYKDELQAIIAADSWQNDLIRQNELRKIAFELLKQYESKFHSVALTIAKGVASRIIPGVSLAMAAFDIGSSLQKILDATDKFCSKFGEQIKHVANSSPQSDYMMRDSLYSYFGSQTANTIMSMLMQVGIIDNHALAYNSCGNIKAIDFGELEQQEHLIEASCIRVSNIIQSDYSGSTDNLQKDLTDMLTEQIMSMVQNELLNPVGNIASTYGVHKVLHNMEEAKKEAAKKIKETQKTSNVLKFNQDNDNKPDPEEEFKNSDWSVKDKERVSRLAADQLTSKGSLIDAQVISKVTDRPISIYRDNKFDIEFKEGARDRLYVNYNSESGEWGYPGSLRKFDSIYEVIAAQDSRYDTSSLREAAHDYVFSHPAVSKSLLEVYKSVENVPIKPKLSSNDNHKYNDPSYDLQSKIELELMQQYGKANIDKAKINAADYIDSLSALPEEAYQIKDGKLMIELPKEIKLASIGNIASIGMDGYKLALEIISFEQAKLLGSRAIKVGKHFAKVSPYAKVAILTYELGKISYNSGGIVKDAVSFTTDLMGKITSKGTILSTPIQEQKGTIYTTPDNTAVIDIEIYETPEYDNELPGFGSLDYARDDASILFKDADGGDNSGFFHQDTDGKWLLSDEVIAKVPKELGGSKPNRRDIGFRWSDGDKGENVVRIDKGDIKLEHPTQKLDHVRINKGGKVIGRDGNPIAPSKEIPNPSSHPDSHIPLEEWINWRHWYKP